MIEYMEQFQGDLPAELLSEDQKRAIRKRVVTYMIHGSSRVLLGQRIASEMYDGDFGELFQGKQTKDYFQAVEDYVDTLRISIQVIIDGELIYDKAHNR